MTDGLVVTYRRYRESRLAAHAETISETMYTELGSWLDSSTPNPGFLTEIQMIFAEFPAPELQPMDLVDLGFLALDEAMRSFETQDLNAAMFYLTEARLPFLAILKEEQYRLEKEHEFSEIDFQIFEIIGPPIPHEAAQTFLLMNDWVDIWIILRYVQNLESSTEKMSLAQDLIRNRKTLPEKLIFFSYLYLEYPELIEDELPPGVPPAILTHANKLLDPFWTYSDLDTSWEERLDPAYEQELVFILLSIFELGQYNANPGWVRVLERGISSFWTIRSPSEELYQPVTEFAASILNLLPDPEITPVLETSLIMPLFFDHIQDYNEEAFDGMLHALARSPELFLDELRFRLPESCNMRNRRVILRGRYQHAAKRLGHEIVLHRGRPILISRKSK